MMAAARQVMEVGTATRASLPDTLGPVVGFTKSDSNSRCLPLFAIALQKQFARQTLEEVVAAKPTSDFDEARLAGAITPDRFVTLVYTDLSRSGQ